MNASLALIIFGFVGVVPAAAVVDGSFSTVFLAPLVSALLAGISAIFVFLTFGSITDWFAVWALIANCLGGAHLIRTRSALRDTTFDLWGAAGCLAIVLAVTWPLLALTAPVMGYDTEAIWLLHSAMVFGGHHEMLTSLVNPAAVTNNPDYPPLVPGAVAVGYKLHGTVDQFQGVWTIALLNSAALGVCGDALFRLTQPTFGPVRRAMALIIVVLFVGACDGFAGVYAVNGYVDLLWAATATGGVLFGLVLPCDRRNLGVALVCVEVASLTKNEGLIVGAVVAVLVGIRYWLVSDRSVRSVWLHAIATGSFVVGGVAWYLAANLHGLHDAFFSTYSGEPISERLRLTVSGMSGQLHIVPIALAVLLVGLAQIGTPGRRMFSPWLPLWIMAGVGTVVFSATYVAGGMEIRWWLYTSANRTAIFINLCLSSDMAIWALGALKVLVPLRPVGRHSTVSESRLHGAEPLVH